MKSPPCRESVKPNINEILSTQLIKFQINTNTKITPTNRKSEDFSNMPNLNEAVSIIQLINDVITITTLTLQLHE